MELGATVCVPNGPPRCEECPAASFCLGRIRGTALSLPVKSGKKERRREEKTVFLLVREGRLALRRRPDTGLLAGLWEFPNVEGALEEASAAAAVEAWGLTPLEWRQKLTARHIFTHVEWEMTGYVLEVRGPGPADIYLGRRGSVFNAGGALGICPVPCGSGTDFAGESVRRPQRRTREEKPIWGGCWDCR